MRFGPAASDQLRGVDTVITGRPAADNDPSSALNGKLGRKLAKNGAAARDDFQRLFI
jgi:hypothetical protein